MPEGRFVIGSFLRILHTHTHTHIRIPALLAISFYNDIIYVRDTRVYTRTRHCIVLTMLFPVHNRARCNGTPGRKDRKNRRLLQTRRILQKSAINYQYQLRESQARAPSIVSTVAIRDDCRRSQMPVPRTGVNSRLILVNLRADATLRRMSQNIITRRNTMRITTGKKTVIVITMK